MTLDEHEREIAFTPRQKSDVQLQLWKLRIFVTTKFDNDRLKIGNHTERRNSKRSGSITSLIVYIRLSLAKTVGNSLTPRAEMGNFR
jgi:hypothetical protein